MNRKIVALEIAALSIMGFVIGVAILSLPDNYHHTASATTDYFSWSCQQLKDAANSHADLGYNAALAPESESQSLITLWLIHIMQLKGCSA